MAAYAALVSIMQIIHEIEHHPFPPISMDKKQVESLTEIITFLQEFLEGYKSPVVDSDEADPLEMHIADTVYAAKDVIESHTVDQILKVVSADFCASLLKVINDGNLMFKKDVTQLDAVKDRLQKQVLESVESSTSTELYESLVKVIENMDLIKKEVMEIVAVDPLQRQVSASTSVAASSTSNNSLASSPSRPESTIMLGFDDVMLQLMEKLIYGRLGRQVIPIVGMGGIGKTTLATNVYKKIVDSYYFDICAWVTISQEYNTKELFCEILSQTNEQGKERLSQMREDEIGQSLHKCLSYRRYLIVLDDMWSIEAWEKLQRYFPDNSNGSRIMVTTRLSNLWSPSDNSYGIEMKFMDEESSWNIFCKIVFGGRISCPLELEKIGKEIVKSCRGLPLSIVVIGGILEKLERTNECWKSVRRSLNSLVNAENDKQCLNILRLSYSHLPVYLKPCFLYMGTFKEDSVIQVSKVIKVWVSEGFLKPVSGKSLETLAKEYLSELVDRNLILVHKFGKTGNMKYLKMHDLVRDLCLREAEKEKFYHLVGQHSAQGMYVEKRVFVPRCTSMEKALHAMKWTLRACDEKLPNLGQNGCSSYWEWETHELLKNLCLREAEKETFYDVVGQHCPQGMCSQHHVFTMGSTSKDKYFDAMEWTSRASGDNYNRRDKDFHRIMFELDNLRLLVVYSQGLVHNQLPSSVNLFWSLQTLIVHCHYDGNVRAPVEIWNMPQLRHVHFIDSSWGEENRGALYLPNPPIDSIVIMENLQTLKGVMNFKCDQMMVRRVPNIKKLGLIYDQDGVIESLDNIDRLQKLESLSCTLNIFLPGKGYFYFRKLTFPHSLKKLTLDMYDGTMEEIFEKLGTLPLLQRLKLFRGRFGTHKWETVEGRFQSLKILSLARCYGLECWTMESSHFPSLEHLHLRLMDLNEIPAELGEIPTLKSMTLEYCSTSAVKSAKRMIEEQEDLQGDELSFKVVVTLREKNEELQSLENPNFRVY